MKITMAEVRDIAEIVNVLNETTKDTGIVQATIEVRLADERGVVLTFDEGDDDWAFEMLDYSQVDEEDGVVEMGDEDHEQDPDATTTLPVVNQTVVSSR